MGGMGKKGCAGLAIGGIARCAAHLRIWREKKKEKPKTLPKPESGTRASRIAEGFARLDDNEVETPGVERGRAVVGSC
jgi:hypothetical protein